MLKNAKKIFLDVTVDKDTKINLLNVKKRLEDISRLYSIHKFREYISRLYKNLPYIYVDQDSLMILRRCISKNV